MKSSPIDDMYRELDSLASDSIEGNLSEEGAARLRYLFEKLPDARQRFAKHFFLDAALPDVFECSANLRRPKSTNQSRRWLAGLAAAAAAVAAAVALVFGIARLMETDSPAPASASPNLGSDDEFNAVALLRELIDVEWADSTTELRVDQPLSPQSLHLESGVLHMEFYCGASVILEGPAKFDLVSPELGVIHYGKLRTHVPAAAKGFTIKTDQFEVLDLGTEFAIDLSRDGTAQVHVIDGEVIFTKKGDAPDSQRLVNGEALGLSLAGAVSRFDARPKDFVGAKEFGELSRAHSLQRTRSWEAMATRLRNDPAAIAHYSFAHPEVWQTDVPNEVDGADSLTDGTVVGCRWGEGRWDGDSALHYSRSSDRLRVNLPGEHTSLTLAAWVRFDSTDTKIISIVSPETGQDTFVHWLLRHTSNDGKLRASFSASVVGTEPKRIHYHCKSPIDEGEAIGNWTLFAVVYDGEGGQLTHFIDGQVASREPIEQPRPVSIGVADIGNWPYHDWAAGTDREMQHLVGALGEFFAAGRAYSENEIAEIYEAGRP